MCFLFHIPKIGIRSTNHETNSNQDLYQDKTYDTQNRFAEPKTLHPFSSSVSIDWMIDPVRILMTDSKSHFSKARKVGCKNVTGWDGSEPCWNCNSDLKAGLSIGCGYFSR